MRKIAILIFAFGVLGASGITINFSYDNAGNRIKRSVPSGRFPLLAEPENSSFLALTDSNITIYPNPTDGPLTVLISSYREGYEGFIYIYDMSGQLVQEKKFKESVVTLTLAEQTKGIYLVKIKLPIGEETWKIIKK